ncbi:MAG: LacI family DNA-binding transcriptional regulator [Bacteroidales bacterium]|nr:LacI family DNA-binding transcriptional regulator [Bacteroidales bacterium]
MAKEKKVSLKDVANAIGVSTALVSIVLNGKAKQYRIGDDMAEKVLKVSKEMNYSPNLIARNLRGGKTQLIGLVVTDISNPFFSSVSRVIENKAIELNYTVIFGSSDENLNNTKNLIEVLLNKGVDGLIIVPCDGSEKLIEKLQERGVPIVLLDRYFPNLNVSFSSLDNFKATELATQHLIDQGYTRISLIAYKSEMNNVTDRILGYEDSMKKAGLGANINIKRVSLINPKPDVNKAIESLINKSKTEAIVFTTNTLSIHGLYCLQDMQVTIPNDVAIVGFDGGDVFDLFYSPITYIEQPYVQIAEEAVTILVNKIKNGEQNKKSMVIIEPKLIVKNSSPKKD